MKRAKPVYTMSNYIGTKASCNVERALSVDPEIKPFVRAKRSNKNLPNSYDTKWIRRQRSWKHRARKASQHIKHFMTAIEKNFLKTGIWRKHE